MYACFEVKSGQERKALDIAGMGNECVYICFDIFVDSGTNYHRCKLWGMSENLICKRVWWVRVTRGISKVILGRKYVGVIYTGGDCIIIIIIIIITKCDKA